MSIRIERINYSIRKIIGQAISTDLSDPRISSSISVTKVSVSHDLSKANVYVSLFLDTDDEEQILLALRSSTGRLRKIISNKLRILKRRVALIVACADICKIWSLGKVTLKLTQFADSSLSTAFDAVVQNFSMKKKKREFNEVFGSRKNIKSSDLGFVVIAMGKMGAF